MKKTICSTPLKHIPFVLPALCILLTILTACKGQKTAADNAPAIDSSRICQVRFCADSAFRFVEEQ